MADVTSELILEILKQLRDRMSSFDRKMDEVKGEPQPLRTHSIGMQQDIHNICATLVRQEARLTRIERRLEISETAG